MLNVKCKCGVMVVSCSVCELFAWFLGTVEWWECQKHMRGNWASVQL